MIDSIPFSLRFLPASGTPPAAASPNRRPLLRSPKPSARAAALMPAEDRASQGMLIGLAAVTLPAAAYCVLQAWHLVGGNHLHQAIQAFVP